MQPQKDLERDERKRKWVARLNRLGDRGHQLFWMAAAIAVLYYSNFFTVIFTHAGVNPVFFAVTLIGFGLFASMTLYAVFGLPQDEEIEVVAPRLVPTATAVAFTTFLTALIAFWPVWGWYTPLIMLVLLMGMLMSGQLMPSGTPGSVLFLLLFVLAMLSGYAIPHEGLLH